MKSIKFKLFIMLICSVQSIWAQELNVSNESESMIQVSRNSEKTEDYITIGEIRKKLFSEEDTYEWNKDLEKAGISPELADKVLVTYHAKERLVKIIKNQQEEIISKSGFTREQLFYIGAQIGFIFPYGAKLIYVNQKENDPYFHAEMELTTSQLIHSLSVGAGYHPWGKNFYVGLKLRQVILYDIKNNGIKGLFNKNENITAFGINPNFGWQFGVTKNRKVLGTVSVGLNKSFGSDFELPPQFDLQFGIAVNVGKISKSR